jgi:hypothetical protein
MAKSNLRLVTPDSELRTVALRRRSNREMGRDREHLTVERLIKVAKGTRHGHHDATMILIGFRHGLRVSESVGAVLNSHYQLGLLHLARGINSMCDERLSALFARLAQISVQAGTTGDLSLCKAPKNLGSILRCAITNSGGERANHWFSETSA